MATLTKRDIDPAKTYRAWTSGVTELAPGQEVTFTKGQQFRGTAPIVKARPNLFVEEGTPADEWPSEFQPADASYAATDRELKAEEAKHMPPPIPAERRVYATTSIVADGRGFAAGVAYDRDDPIVKKNLQHFEIRTPLVPS